MGTRIQDDLVELIEDTLEDALRLGVPFPIRVEAVGANGARMEGYYTADGEWVETHPPSCDVQLPAEMNFTSADGQTRTIYLTGERERSH